MFLSLPGPVRPRDLLPPAADRFELLRWQRAGFEERRVFAPTAGVRGADDRGAYSRHAQGEAQGDGDALFQRKTEEIVVQLLEPLPVGLVVGVLRRLASAPGGIRDWPLGD